MMLEQTANRFAIMGAVPSAQVSSEARSARGAGGRGAPTRARDAIRSACRCGSVLRARSRGARAQAPAERAAAPAKVRQHVDPHQPIADLRHCTLHHAESPFGHAGYTCVPKMELLLDAAAAEPADAENLRLYVRPCGKAARSGGRGRGRGRGTRGAPLTLKAGRVYFLRPRRADAATARSGFDGADSDAAAAADAALRGGDDDGEDGAAAEAAAAAAAAAAVAAASPRSLDPRSSGSGSELHAPGAPARERVLCAVCGQPPAAPTRSKCGHVCCRRCWAAFLRESGREQCPECAVPVEAQDLHPVALCPVCECELRAPLRAPCGHAACGECWDNLLAETKACPECAAPLSPSQLVRPGR
jgi:hypothetical protein